MASLDGDDITQITTLIDHSTDRLLDRISEKIDLTVEPLKRELEDHIQQDYQVQGEIKKDIKKLFAGQATILSDIRLGRFVGCGIGTIAIIIMPIAINYFVK